MLAGKDHMSVRILITGAGGFLGKAVYSTLKTSFTSVLGIARNTSDYGAQCDLSDFESSRRILEDFQPTHIVNIAANADFSDGALARMYTINSLFPALLADYCAKSGCVLVQASGTIIHGTQNDVYSYNTPCEPNNDYGTSKYLADQMILASGASAAVLRFGGIYGYDGPDHLGINKAMRLANKGKAPVLYGDGMARRNYTYVYDAARFIENCIRQDLRGVHYVAGETVTIKQMLEIICNVFLPNQKIIQKDGGFSRDQIIESVSDLIEYTDFETAVQREKDRL